MWSQPQNVLTSPTPVGASLLAKVVNADAGILNERGVFKFFASKLAPTGSEPVPNVYALFAEGSFDTRRNDTVSPSSW
ncbi:hypothetical protein CI807_05820 [Pseudomonas sp. NS1(2017)]|nr:hypothetical protein CI807_05820 [Pseudomonas sp. NS1(2017)]